MNELHRLCVFCGSSDGIRPAYRAAAVAVGVSIAARGWELIYGGGTTGLMGAVADATMAGGAKVTGVIPRGLFATAAVSGRITNLHDVATMHERKALMYQLSDAFIALPGGLGTLEELAETLTWRQIGLHDKPAGLLDVDGFYRPLQQFLAASVTEGFTRDRYVASLDVSDDPEQLLDRLAARVAAGEGGHADVERL